MGLCMANSFPNAMSPAVTALVRAVRHFLVRRQQRSRLGARGGRREPRRRGGRLRTRARARPHDSGASAGDLARSFAAIPTATRAHGLTRRERKRLCSFSRPRRVAAGAGGRRQHRQLRHDALRGRLRLSAHVSHHRGYRNGCSRRALAAAEQRNSSARRRLESRSELWPELSVAHRARIRVGATALMKLTPR